MQRIFSLASRFPGAAVRMQRAQFSVATKNAWGIFPREREGNMFSVNWSLNEHGVTPVGDAHRNARAATLEKKLGANASKIALTGKYTVAIAGEGLPHGDFANLISKQRKFLSSGVELYVEDASVGSAHVGRQGVRVVSHSPATAMIARNLLIPTSNYVLDHRARFDGWNKDPRWIGLPEGHFDASDTWVDVNAPNQASPGQRPIVVYVGGAGDNCAVQFVQIDKVIVGADISVGASTPVRGMIEAITVAACEIMNGKVADSVAVPSCTVVKNGVTTVIVGADDSVVDAFESNIYGAYANLITPTGVAALFNGVLGAAGSSTAAASKFTAPLVVNGGKAVKAIQPDNMISRPASIVFFEAGAAKKTLSEEEIVNRLVALTDDTKKEAIAALAKGMKGQLVGSAKDCL